MLKVVIADDEARVLSLIKMLIDWDALGMELAGTASNGLEALELVKTAQPDILITDIRMPGLYGIELIERAKKVIPQLEIVIISGYAHFEYAQSAIRFGVGDYLLKPINKQELMDTLFKLGERCRSRSKVNTEVENLRKSSMEDKEKLKSRLLEDLYTGRSQNLTAQRLLEEYRWQPEGEVIKPALLIMDYDRAQITDASLKVIAAKAEGLFKQELQGRCCGLLMHMEDNVGCLLIDCRVDQLVSVRRGLRSCLNQMEAQRVLFGGIAFTLAVSPEVDAPERLPEACRQTKLIAMERLTEGTGRLLEKLAPSLRMDRERALRGCMLSAEERLEHITPQQIQDAVEAIREEAEARSPVRGSEIYAIVLEAGRIFLQRPEVQDNERAFANFEEDLRMQSSAEGLFDTLEHMMRTELDRIQQQQKNGAARPIRMAKQFVQQHYHEPITLEQVCEQAGFSVSYFSALFKKETGENFVKYLTRVRMEHARELLQETNLSISEVCVRVGYNDIKHFTQTFKKETNLNPGQYRKLYG